MGSDLTEKSKEKLAPSLENASEEESQDSSPEAIAINGDCDEHALRYSLHSMLIVMAMIALGIVLLKWFWLWGFVLIFVVSIGVELGTFKVRKRLGNIVSTAVWGVVFPVLCIFYDPGLLHDPWIMPAGPGAMPIMLRSEMHITWDSMSNPLSIFSISAIVIQCLTLGTWILWQPRNPVLADIIIGIMIFGLVLAILIGICLLPLTLMGIVILIGILGITPFLTARAYLFAIGDASRISQAKRSEKKGPMSDIARVAGFCLAFVIPFWAAVVFAEPNSSFPTLFNLVTGG
jgi:hypothetical protein